MSGASPLPTIDAATLEAGVHDTLDVAQGALIDALASEAGTLTIAARGRIARAFGVVFAYAVGHVRSFAELKDIPRLLDGEIPAGAPQELASAVGVLLRYRSLAERVAQSVADQVAAATASFVGTAAAKVGVAFLRALLASFGIVLPAA